MTPQQFITKWGPGGPAFDLNEEQGAQSHFLDLCDLLNVPKPGSAAGYRFEEKNTVIGGKIGYADVFMPSVFAWENKAPGKNLDAALKQLLTYSLALSNPPILVVCDRLIIRIHTQFNGHPSETHTVLLNQLDQPDKLALLRRIWLDPESFRPKFTSRDITNKAANSFATLAEGLRRRNAKPDDSAEIQEARANQVAHFLTQCLFCFFAEDVGLLPGRMFERLVNNKRLTSERLNEGLRDLFNTMGSGGMFGVDDIPWFNGGLFKRIDVPTLSILDMTELRNAAALNWSAIDVSIFGTLFERGLDPAKRSQLGAHYTDPATIMRIVQPVIERPLLQLWEVVTLDLNGLMAKSRKKGDAGYRAARERFVKWLDELAAYRILDPACGSGNFLFLGLKALKDIEHKSHLDTAALGLDREADLVTGPHNVLGIELNEYAAELARVTVWIGELQWRMAHGYEFKTNPVLEPLDHIECRDALLTLDAGVATEAPWPKASVVIGNPPFLGGSKKRRELGDNYFSALETVFKGRVPGGADLVCYWFDKALKAIETNTLGAAGLVSTQSIRNGANRSVLDSIVKRTRIFDAWSDESWVNDGAAVRVSLICFGSVETCSLNGQPIDGITASLGSSYEPVASNARALAENAGFCFQGSQKIGAFDIRGDDVRPWLSQPNPHGKSNSEVLKPCCNGIDVSRRSRDVWIVDFGLSATEAESSLFELPFQYVVSHVKPERIQNPRETRAKYWWRHGDGQPAMRRAIAALPRYIATPEVTKHRIFSWMHAAVLPDKKLIVTASADDVTFGILSNRIHEIWALELASMHGKGNDPRYTPTTCFETFPFPLGLTPADTAHQMTEAADGALIPSGLSGSLKANAARIAQAAKRLDDLRNNWLNPPEWTHKVKEAIPLGMDKSPYPDRIEPKPGISEADLKALQKRTLTNLYNLRPQWLAHAHEQLDLAVSAAYGWTDYSATMPDDEILKRLLALNLERSSEQ
jgi:hypothetical protein